jgi:hemolysin III
MSFAELLAPNAEDLAEHYPNRAERAADGLVHAVGFIAAFIGGGVLLALALQRGGVPLATGAAIYAFCLMAMLTASAVYNLTRPSRARRLLRRIDEGAIFLMIAGSYTPFTIQLLPPGYAIGVTAAVWAIALAGALGKVFWSALSDKLWCVVYLAFGWLAVIILGPIVLTLPAAAQALLGVAAATYTGGVLLYLNHALPFRRALWHGCVVLGAAGHYGAMLFGLMS